MKKKNIWFLPSLPQFEWESILLALGIKYWFLKTYLDHFEKKRNRANGLLWAFILRHPYLKPLAEYVTMLESIFKAKFCLIKYKEYIIAENLDRC